MIKLFEFQSVASVTIAERFATYWLDRPRRGTTKKPRKVPFYQALEALTGAGKTAILADAVERARISLPVEPFVIWLSKGRVVVAQTYSNLQQGGKYHHLIDSYSINYLSEYQPEFALDAKSPYLFFATVGTFNQKDKECGDRLIFKSEIDTADISTWNALKRREDINGYRRPLIIVYDEAQNLSDQQTNLLLELEPDAILVASATMRIPTALGQVINELREAGWTEETLITKVQADDVVESGLVKSNLSIGGYQAPMELAIDEMLEDMTRAEQATIDANLPFRPKAIYVAKTNIVEGNSFQRDDAKQPFEQRLAPPIVIWKYLVYEKKVDPTTIAVYCSLDLDKNHPFPKEFILFKGDDDYDQFIAGRFRHVIFNLGLQEGWDDPSCYFAYIDKSMGSAVQVEQLVGRVLRQPAARHYDVDVLNTASFYVRVDARAVFSEVVKAIRSKIQQDAPAMRITTYGFDGNKRPVSLKPKMLKFVPKVYADSSGVLEPVARLISSLPDFRHDSGVNVNGEGSRAVIQQRLHDKADTELTWVAVQHSNRVTARWVFQRAVQRLYPKALDLAGSDDAKFDAKVEIGSIAYKTLEALADNVVRTYFQYVRLAQRPHNPFAIREMNVDPTKIVQFKHSLHDGYASLNGLETIFCQEIDLTGLSWCRNPSRTGFGIPLLSIGRTAEFYPDFIVWSGDDVFVIDTTGEHLIQEKTGRKLLAIEPSSRVKERLYVRLITKGEFNDQVEQVSRNGYTVWRLRQDRKMGVDHASDISDAIEISLTPDK